MQNSLFALRGDGKIVFAEVLYSISKAVLPDAMPQGQALQAFRDGASQSDYFELIQPHAEILQRAGLTVPAMAAYVKAMLGLLETSHEGQLSMLLLSLWANSLYPQIVVGHKYAAALMATRLTSEVVPYIKVPFGAFQVALPYGLLFVMDAAGNRSPIVSVLAGRYMRTDGVECWAYGAYSEGGATLYKFGHTHEQLLDSPDVWTPSPVDPFEMTLDAEDDRTGVLLNRLILSLCLAMTHESDVKTVGTGHHRYAQHAATSGHPRPEPAIRTFQVGRPIKQDLRGHVEAFVRGTRKTLSVRSVVCGHFKPQLGARLGKVVWIAPYERGPGDAPILLRPRILEGT